MSKASTKPGNEPTFRDAYGVLQRHAETLRNQREPNIDDLLTIVTESVAAYQVCKRRIDAVELALEQALVGAGVEGAQGASAAATKGSISKAVPSVDASDPDAVPSAP